MKHILPLLCLVGLMPTVHADKKEKNYEKYLADSAAHLATDRLIKNKSDQQGRQLIDAALKLDVDNEQALLVFMLLKRKLEIKPVKHKYTATTFAKTAISRGKTLFDKTMKSNPGAGKLSKLYFLLAELFKPGDRTVLIYLTRLEKIGIKDGLGELLAGDTTASNWLKAKVDDGEKKDAVHFWGIGKPNADITALYGKTYRTKYTRKINGTLRYYKTSNGDVEVFFAGGKCQRVQFRLSRNDYPTREKQDAYVLTDRTGWKLVHETSNVRGYANSDGTMAASISRSGSRITFVAWSKKFYK